MYANKVKKIAAVHDLSGVGRISLTGDTFTSVITGSLMQGDSLPIALDRATQFILQGIRATFGYEYDNREGILLEKVLHNLDMPIQISSYELI